MKTLAIFAALVFVSIAGQVHAEEAFKFDGNHLLEACSAADRFGEGDYRSGWREDSAFYLCHGYVRGVMDTLDAMVIASKLPQGACVPPDITQGQIIRVFVKFLRDHPEDLHLRGNLLFMRAIARSYPCR